MKLYHTENEKFSNGYKINGTHFSSLSDTVAKRVICIVGKAEMIEESGISPEQKEMLQDIVDFAKTINTARLLDLDLI